MVDVLVSSGGPKPWGFYQRELAALSPRFISGDISSFKRDLPSPGSMEYTSSYCGSSIDSPSSIHPQSRASLKRLRSQSLSSEYSESEMQMQMEGIHSSKDILYCDFPDPQLRHQPTMPPYTNLIAPSMKTTHSSSGSFHDEVGNADQISQSFAATTPELYTGAIDAIPLTNSDWLSKNLSFISETEDTPSLSSSFDFMDSLKDDPPCWDNISCAAINSLPSINSNDSFQPFEPQLLPDVSCFPWHLWSPWPLSTQEQFPQPYITGMIPEERASPFQGYLATDWQENMDNQMNKFTKTSASFDNLQAVTGIPYSTPMAENTSVTAKVTPATMPAPVYQGFELPISTYSIQPAIKGPSNTVSVHANAELRSTRNTHRRDAIMESPIPTPQHRHSQSQSDSNSLSLTEPTEPKERFPPHLQANVHHIDRRNAFLLDCKRRGLSYKEIKARGNFKEAESTLRGRFRTLTKSKDQRVRKPIWLPKDIKLLCKGVEICEKVKSKSRDKDDAEGVSDLPEGRRQWRRQSLNQPPKVSWKKVADYISKNGGSYHFGNATCKKKWCEIHKVAI